MPLLPAHAVKIAIAGSRKLPQGAAYLALVKFLVQHTTDTILVRCAVSGDMGDFETDVVDICETLHMAYEGRSPDVASTPGRASVFRRDIELVEEADLTLIYIAEADLEEGYSGTYHLWEKALDGDRPVYAWTFSADPDHPRIVRWGEHDPGERFAALFD